MVASAAGVAVPFDEVGRASALPLFFFAADFDSTFGADPFAGAMIGGGTLAAGNFDAREGVGDGRKSPHRNDNLRNKCSGRTGGMQRSFSSIKCGRSIIIW